MQAQPELKEIPVLIQSIVHDRELGQSLGAVDFLPKPLEREALLATLERWSPGGRGGAPWAWIAVGQEHAGVEEALSLIGYQVYKLGMSPPPLGNEVELLILDVEPLQGSVGRMLGSLQTQIRAPSRIWCVCRDQADRVMETWGSAWRSRVECVSWEEIMRRLRPRVQGESTREP